VNDGAEADRPSTRQLVAFRVFATIAWLGRVLPTTTGRVLFGWAGTAAFHLLPGVRATVAGNMSQVLGRPVDDPFVRSATRDAFRRYARYWFDAFDVVTWPDERVVREFVFEGLHNLRDAIEAGTGALAVLPHMGNWDAAGRAMHAHGMPVVSVAERLRPAALTELFLEHRRALGMDIIGLDDGNVGRQLGAALTSNRVVALVADRDLSGRGVEVEMFGRSRRLPPGPALLSLQTGAPIVVADILETKRGWRCILHQPLTIEISGDRRADATALTQELATAFERGISASPSDWHMFQPGWDA
jgi:lauroyl/myristoyl acyltransferase